MQLSMAESVQSSLSHEMDISGSAIDCRHPRNKQKETNLYSQRLRLQQISPLSTAVLFDLPAKLPYPAVRKCLLKSEIDCGSNSTVKYVYNRSYSAKGTSIGDNVLWAF